MTEPAEPAGASVGDRRPLPATLVIAATDLRRRLRNRSAIVSGFIGPLALAAVFGLLLGGTQSIEFTIGVVDADGSATSRALVASLTAESGPAPGSQASPNDDPEADSEADSGSDGGESPVRLQVVEGGDAAARAQVDDGDLAAAIVVPPGFGVAATSGSPTTLTVLRSPEQVTGGLVAESVANSVASGFNQVGVAVGTLSGVTGRPPTAEDVSAAQAAVPAMGTTSVSAAAGEVDVTAYFGAAMSMLFLFFTIGFAARSLLAERMNGTLNRILATPAGPGSVIAGKTASVTVLGLAGFVTVWAVTSLAFGASWGPWLLVLPLVVATVFAVGGVATLVASIGRTEQQADAYTSMVAFVLALLGGNFVGPGPTPDALRTLSLLTPNGWALRGFTDAAAGVATAASIGLSVAVLAAIGLVTGVAGIARVRRTVLQ